MIRIPLDDLQFEQAVLRCFRENYNTPSGIPRLFQSFTFTWKWFWQNFRMPKPEFNEKFVKLVNLNRQSNRSYRINVYGGPTNAYTGINFLVYRGKHYILWGITEVESK